MFFFFPALLLLLSILRAKGITNDYVVDKLDAIVQDGFEGLFATASYKGKDEYYLKNRSTIAKTLNITALFESDNEFTITITRGEKAPKIYYAS